MLLRLHAEDQIRHLDEKAVVQKGGPVYREDLRDVKESLDQRIRSESEQTRALIRAQPTAAPPVNYRCRAVSGGGLDCVLRSQ